MTVTKGKRRIDFNLVLRLILTVTTLALGIPNLYRGKLFFSYGFLAYAAMKYAGLKQECGDLAKKSEELLRNHPEIPADVPILFYSSLKNQGKTELWSLIAQASDIKL